MRTALGVPGFALVIGGASRIGRAIVQPDINLSSAQAVQRELETLVTNLKFKCVAMQADV
jgi:hypothetical protein